jgi:hypothetical protein
LSGAAQQVWWYALLPEGRHGPLRRGQLQRLIDEGAVQRTTPLWRHGLPGWMPAQDCFGPAFGATAPAEGRLAAPRRSGWPLLLAGMALSAWLGLQFYRYSSTINDSADPYGQVTRAVAIGAALVLSLFLCTALSLRRGRSAGVRLLGASYAILGVVLLVVLVAVGPQLGRATRASGRMSGYAISVDQGGATIRIDGLLGPGVATGFERALADHPQVRRLVIESYGGLVDQSLELARSIVAHGLDVEVDQHCASACLVPFLAGARRYAGPQALFGFHSPGALEGASEWLKFGAEKQSRSYTDFLRSHGLPQKYLDLVRDTPSASIARIGAVELAEAGVLQVLGANGEPLTPQQAKWSYIAAAMREGSGAGDAATAGLMQAIQRSGHPAAQRYVDPLFQAIQASDAARTRTTVAALTGSVFEQAVNSAAPAALTGFLVVQDQVLQKLVAQGDWQTCARFIDGRFDSGAAAPVPPELEPALLDSMSAVVDSAAGNQWRRTEIDPADRARVGAISQSVTAQVQRLGFSQAQLGSDPQARCRFAAGLYHELARAEGNRPGEYLAALLGMQR